MGTDAPTTVFIPVHGALPIGSLSSVLKWSCLPSDRYETIRRSRIQESLRSTPTRTARRFSPCMLRLRKRNPWCRRSSQATAPGGGSSPAHECSSAHDPRPLARRSARLGRPPRPRPARRRRGNPVRRGPGHVRLAAQDLAQWHAFNLTPRAGPRHRQWLLDYLGHDYFGHVEQVELGPRNIDAVMKQVGQLDKLRRLSFFNRDRPHSLGECRHRVLAK